MKAAADKMLDETTIVSDEETHDNAAHVPVAQTRLNRYKKARLLAYLGLFITPMFWAGNFLLSRMASYDLSPMTLSFWRWLFALAIILPFGFKHVVAQQQQIRVQIKPLLILAALGIATYNSLLYIAAHSTTAINMTLFAAALPIVTILLAWKILHIEPSRYQIAGICFAVLGFLSIMTQGSIAAFGNVGFNVGDVLMLVATLCWSLYSVLYRKWQINLHPMALLTTLIALGTIMVSPFYLYSLWDKGGFYIENHIIFMLIFLAIFPSILAFLFWNKGLLVLGPSVTAIFMYLVPVFTAILSIPILGEQLHYYHFLGGGAIMLGVFVATVFNDRQTARTGSMDKPEPSLATPPNHPVNKPDETHTLFTLLANTPNRQQILRYWQACMHATFTSINRCSVMTFAWVINRLKQMLRMISFVLINIAAGLKKVADS